MKIFMFLMAVYILVLTAVPCNNINNKCNNKNSKTELTLNIDHPQDKDDCCTPFWTCDCCITSLLAIDFPVFSFKKPLVFDISQKIIIRNFFFISDYFGSIWQPPQLS